MMQQQRKQILIRITVVDAAEAARQHDALAAQFDDDPDAVWDCLTIDGGDFVTQRERNGGITIRRWSER